MAHCNVPIADRKSDKTGAWGVEASTVYYLLITDVMPEISVGKVYLGAQNPSCYFTF